MLLVGLAFIVSAYFTPHAVTTSFLSGLSGNFISLAIALFLVNVYLDKKGKRAGVLALLGVTQHHVSNYHNHWLTICWNHFGKDRFTSIVKEYLGGGAKPDALSTETRLQLYTLFKDDQHIRVLLSDLDGALTELSRLAGWNLSPDVLEGSLKTRLSISKLRSTVFDDNQSSIDQVTENALDTDIQSSLVLASLAGAAGLNIKGN